LEWKRAALAWAGLCLFISLARGQYQDVSQKLSIGADLAITWSKHDVQVLQLQGSVVIDMDTARLKGDSAVVWLTPIPDSKSGQQIVQVALIGEAVLSQQENHVTRNAPRLMVSGVVEGTVQLRASTRSEDDASDSELYKLALSLRNSAATRGSTGPTTRGGPASTEPSENSSTEPSENLLQPEPGGETEGPAVLGGTAIGARPTTSPAIAGELISAPSLPSRPSPATTRSRWSSKATSR